jgi:hypothetical protein
LGLALAAPSIAQAQYSLGQPHYLPVRPATPQYSGTGLDLVATRPHRPGYCPPGYQPSNAAPDYYQAPHYQTPGTTPQVPGQQVPAAQGMTQPQSSGQATPSTTSPSAQPDATNQANTQPTMQNDFSAAQSSSSRASLSPGADTPQLGRVDSQNRMNIFDTMAAAPQTRVWSTFQYAEGFNTGLRPTDALQDFLSIYPNFTLDNILALNEGITSNYFTSNESVYRVGGEYALTENFSIAVQGQYIGNSDDDDASDEWTNPQILFKQVLYRDYDTILTGTLGVTPETSSERGDINERATKIYPGLLFYEGLSRNFFLQGGVQTGIPTDHNEIDHTDWSLALSYWLYRDCCPKGEGRCHRPFFLRQFHITGIIPQVNILGKHVMGSNQIVGPFGFLPVANQVITGYTSTRYDLCDPVTGLPVPGPGIVITTPDVIAFSLPDGFVIYEEPRNVVDLTVGTTILMGDGIQVGVGYSFPLTDDSVRDNELITSLSYVF